MHNRPLARTIAAVAFLALVTSLGGVAARAVEVPKTGGGGAATMQPAGRSDQIEFLEETLPNGLRVIYAPLRQAPVVHVRVLYHVGSRDERPDRQGFAHMFEHMMFRGSEHVKPEEHMKLIGAVGGNSNAFTSFDQTVYINTVPSNHTEMALYLEADRMASFKVSADVYKTERKVVAEEWRIRQNRPYGTMYEDFLKEAFTTHSYRWTPIGNMSHLAAAEVGELQDFFNTYYLPNNAILVIAGNFYVAEAKEWVQKYYGWIPRGPEVRRAIPPEPKQAQARTADVAYRVPLPAVLIGWQTPEYSSDDHYALDLLGTILGSGRSSRLDRLLVNTEKPLAVDASAGNMQLQDAGVFTASATVMQGKDPAEVERLLNSAVAELLEKGVTDDELTKAKTQARKALVQGRETAVSLATQLGSEALFANDAARVNRAMARIDAVTPADVKAVANKYLAPQLSTTLRVKPDPLGTAARTAATQAAALVAPDAPVAPTTKPVAPRTVQFPADYPKRPPMSDKTITAAFDKGTETTIDGVKVIVIPDSRLPTVAWSLTMPNGSHFDPKGKEGLASLTGDMLRRGAADLSFAKLNEDLESRGIALEVGDLGDFTRIAGSALSSDLEHGLLRTRQVLFQPTFPAEEFAKLKEKTVNELQLSQDTPATVAGNDLEAALFGASALGVNPTPQSVGSISLDDVKAFYASQFRRPGSILLLAGDVTVERGQQLARELLGAWPQANTSPAPSPAADAYRYPDVPVKRKIVVVDRPGAKGAVVRMGIRAYDINSPDKFAGSVAGQILTAGIDSRLNRYVRAERGLSYGVHGVFQPNRHGGAFVAGTDCAIENVAESAEAMFKVFEDMRRENVTPPELAEAKTRVAGSMVMGMQTVGQQAQFRVDGILNKYPIDYYDTYPAKIAAVTAEQVRDVMTRYADYGRMTLVVVAPAEAVAEQLKRVGDVEVVPMPAKRGGAGGAAPKTRTTQPATQPGELLQPKQAA